MANKRLLENEPSEDVAGLQEELISVKMREAESSLALKDMRQRLAELEQHWAKYVHVRAFDPSSASIEKDSTSDAHTSPQQQPSPPLSSARARLAKFTAITASFIGGSTEEPDNCISVRELEDQLMGVRIKEADTLAELKEMRQKVMELETQNHVCTNQLKRQDEEMKRVREESEQLVKKRKELELELKDEKEKMANKDSEVNEQRINDRLKYSEAMQTIQDLRSSISQLELKKAEKWTQNQLRGSSVCDLDEDSNSHGSICSNVDHLSLASDEMNALIADMTVRIPTLDELNEEGSATETDELRPKVTLITRFRNNQHWLVIGTKRRQWYHRLWRSTLWRTVILELSCHSFSFFLRPPHILCCVNTWFSQCPFPSPIIFSSFISFLLPMPSILPQSISFSQVVFSSQLHTFFDGIIAPHRIHCTVLSSPSLHKAFFGFSTLRNYSLRAKRIGTSTISAFSFW